MSDVVEIYIDRKPCEIEVKEIECGPALEYKFSFEDRVLVEFDQRAPSRDFQQESEHSRPTRGFAQM